MLVGEVLVASSAGRTLKPPGPSLVLFSLPAFCCRPPVALSTTTLVSAGGWVVGAAGAVVVVAVVVAPPTPVVVVVFLVLAFLAVKLPLPASRTMPTSATTMSTITPRVTAGSVPPGFLLPVGYVIGSTPRSPCEHRSGPAAEPPAGGGACARRGGRRPWHQRTRAARRGAGS